MMSDTAQTHQTCQTVCNFPDVLVVGVLMLVVVEEIGVRVLMVVVEVQCW